MLGSVQKMSAIKGRTAALFILLLVTTAACSPSRSAPTDSAESTPAAEPSAAEPSGGAAPSAAAGARTTWGPVSLTLPGGLTPVKVPSTDVLHRFGAVGKVSASGQAPALAVVVQDRPQRSARVEATSGAEVARVSGGADSLTLKQVTIPGADDAWSLEYDEKALSAAIPPLHRSSLIADAGDRLVVIEARAAGAEYRNVGLAAALASVRLSP